MLDPECMLHDINWLLVLVSKHTYVFDVLAGCSQEFYAVDIKLVRIGHKLYVFWFQQVWEHGSTYGLLGHHGGGDVVFAWHDVHVYEGGEFVEGLL